METHETNEGISLFHLIMKLKRVKCYSEMYKIVASIDFDQKLPITGMTTGHFLTTITMHQLKYKIGMHTN